MPRKKNEAEKRPIGSVLQGFSFSYRKISQRPSFIQKLKEQKNTPSSLSAIQQWMQNAILQPYAAEGIEEMVEHSSRLSAKAHLAIYQRSYVARLRHCMSKQFSALEYALGERIFQQFVGQYLQTYPSTSYTLMDLGERFAKYLEETRPDKNAEKKEDWPDFLIELTNFEHQLVITFDEFNDEPYKSVTTSTDDEKLRLVPVFKLFAFNFPIPQYYKAVKSDQQPGLPFEQPSWCAIYRVNYRIAYCALNYWQYRFLTLFKENKDVERTLLSIAHESNNDLETVLTFWKDWKQFWLEEKFFAYK